MSTIFDQYYVRPGYVDVPSIIKPYIDAALAPWKPGVGTVYVMEREYSGSGFVTVLLEIELLPDMKFEYDILPDVKTNEEYAHRLGQKAFNFYRNRPTLPIDDHIVLGED